LQCDFRNNRQSCTVFLRNEEQFAVKLSATAAEWDDSSRTLGYLFSAPTRLGGAVPKAAPGGGAPPPAGPAPAGGKRGGGGASASLDMKKEDRKSVPVAEAKLTRKYKGGNYLTIGENIHRGKKPLKKIQCNAQCDEGQMHYFKMDANAPFYGRIMLDANGAAMRLTKSVSGRSHGANVSRPTQIGFDFDGQRGLQNGVVIQIDPKKPVDNVSRGKGNAVTYAPAPTRASLPTMQTEEPTVNASAEAKPTTTEKRDVGSIIEQGGYENIKARKGWLIWAIFYGFFCGSLVALVLAVLVLYFGRRAFYADWILGIRFRTTV
uniref:FHA domain-containing protein n=1 Tax=Nippostrongylus brasiliensis TaxID=27835 RepID=A0A0N4YTQ1_NIPBR